MSTPQNPTRRPVLLWPGIAGLVVQWLVWFVIPLVYPSAGPVCVIGGLLGGLVILIWWLFFSHASWPERLGALALIPIALSVTWRLVHKSIAGGMMGLLLFIYAIPLVCLALVAWAVVCGRLLDGRRRVLLVTVVLLACLPLTLVRTDGITGDSASQFAWRWSPTAEQKLMAQAADGLDHKKATPPAEANSPAMIEPQWPGFRGPERDGVVRGSRIDTDWSASPPVRIWSRPVGPGWSSFAVQGDLFFTQEQRGDEELVTCYRVSTGELVWKHSDPARFWESNAGAGPRATPTLWAGRVYTFGGTGMLNALDARNGALVWSRNAASDAGRKIPGWGFAGSPLVVNDMVVVAVGGWLEAYDLPSGKPRWSGPPRGWGYSSPQLARIDGNEQVLLLNGAGAIGVSPADGKVLWEYSWPSDGIVQPALASNGDILVGSGSGMPGSGTGTRRIALSRGTNGWTVAERWRSVALKPYYNDFVVHKGVAFGFDGSFMACINLEDGQRKWKGGRYGHGQTLLLSDQEILLVLSEAGELALVSADPNNFTELSRVPALKGKTWNHPVLTGDILLLRNSEEMAAFKLRTDASGKRLGIQ